MDEDLPLISIRVYKLGNVGWCVDLSPGFSIASPHKHKTKAEAMKFAKALRKAIADFNPMDESDKMRTIHAMIKHELLNRVSST